MNQNCDVTALVSYVESRKTNCCLSYSSLSTSLIPRVNLYYDDYVIPYNDIEFLVSVARLFNWKYCVMDSIHGLKFVFYL